MIHDEIKLNFRNDTVFMSWQNYHRPNYA